MPDYVCDTHALAWYLSGSQKLSVNARTVLDEAINGGSLVIVPAIVIAELIMMIEKRGLAIDLSEVIATLRQFPGFLISSLSPEITLRIQTLTQLADLHDRLIVAEALERSAILLTRDEQVAGSGLVPVAW